MSGDPISVAQRLTNTVAANLYHLGTSILEVWRAFHYGQGAPPLVNPALFARLRNFLLAGILGNPRPPAITREETGVLWRLPDIEEGE